MATNDMGPGPLKKARRLVKKITQKVTKGTFLEDSKKYPGEKNNPFAQKGGTTKKYQKGGPMVAPTTGSGSVANFIKERSPLKPKPKKIGLKDNRLKSGIKMQKGGKTTSFTDDIATGLDNVFRKTYPFNIPHTKVTKALKAVDDRITKGHEGEQPDWYNKFKDKVKKTMHVPLKKNQKGGGTGPINEQFSKATGIPVPSKKATKKTLRHVSKKGSGLIAPTKGKAPAGWSTPEGSTPSTRRYQNGGTGMTQPMLPPKPKTYPTGNKGIKGIPRPQIGGKGNEGYNSYTNPPKPSMNAAEYKAKVIERYGSEENARNAKAIQKKGGATKKMKIGGMVTKKKKYGEGGRTTTAQSTPMEQSSQPNTPPVGTNKLTGNPRFKTGGMVNANSKITASKVAKGRPVKSTAPKKALPKASYGMSMSKMQMGGGTGDGTRTFKEITITAPKPKGKPKAKLGMSITKMRKK